MSQSIVLHAGPHPQQAEYDARLAQRVEVWAAKHPTAYEVIRLGVLTRFGKSSLTVVDPESLVGIMLDEAVRHEVRKTCHWPTFAAWIRESP